MSHCLVFARREGVGAHVVQMCLQRAELSQLTLVTPDRPETSRPNAKKLRTIYYPPRDGFLGNPESATEEALSSCEVIIYCLTPPVPGSTPEDATRLVASVRSLVAALARAKAEPVVCHLSHIEAGRKGWLGQALREAEQGWLAGAFRRVHLFRSPGCVTQTPPRSALVRLSQSLARLRGAAPIPTKRLALALVGAGLNSAPAPSLLSPAMIRKLAEREAPSW